ncbi:hypothetical protein GCM10025859_67920 [Alicyclobacillus fastidiosus]|nr:hypothetical protein GCM10025859_67920 [Alicyclobacillus fastidiosus]
MLQQEIPVADWADAAVDWLTENLSGFFSFLQTVGQTIMDGMTNLLSMISPLILIVLLAVAAYLPLIENGECLFSPFWDYYLFITKTCGEIY